MEEIPIFKVRHESPRKAIRTKHHGATNLLHMTCGERIEVNLGGDSGFKNDYFVAIQFCLKPLEVVDDSFDFPRSMLQA